MTRHDTDRPSQENGPARNDTETRMTRDDTELPSTLSRHGPSPAIPRRARHGTARICKSKEWHGITERKTKSMTRHDTEQKYQGAHMTWHGATRSSMSKDTAQHGTEIMKEV